MPNKRFDPGDYLTKTYQPQAAENHGVNAGGNYQPVSKPTTGGKPATPTGSGLPPAKRKRD